jgi:predicted alpha/beta hydrolase
VARDGQRLGAWHFTPVGRGPARAVVVVLGATGVAQRYYRRFAEALTAHGLEVVTVDYRGIGESKPATLRGFECRYRHWAELDAWAAVDFGLSRGPVVVVGHSFGGHAFGQLPEPNRTLGLVTVATGAAWSGYMPLSEQPKVELLWKVVGPPATRLFGYLPGRLWGGEDLPLGVYRDWDRWSHLPRYFFDDPALDMQARFDRVRVPVVGLTAEDDRWAPARSMTVFLSHYRNAPLALKTFAPADLGVDAVGHLGQFKAPALPGFVRVVLEHIEERLRARAA